MGRYLARLLAIGELVRELISHRVRATIGKRPTGRCGLFPAPTRAARCHLIQLGLRLASHGIDARAARTSLMLHLASEGLSPIFLADLLGLHAGTAVKWVHAAGGDWITWGRGGGDVLIC